MREQKTHADIIGWMRKSSTGPQELADMLEASHRRELHDATLRGIQAAKKSFYEVIDEIGPLYSTEPIGNAANLRDALEAAKYCLVNRRTCSGYTMEDTIAKIDAALAAPPRNCDVGTAEEQVERFKNFCRNHQFISVDSEDHFPPVYVCSNESCPLHDYYIAHGEDNCELAWAQMPHKEGGQK